MGKYSFKVDLIAGENGERVVSEHVVASTKSKFISYNKDNRYDFIVEKDSVLKTYEVKTDEFSRPGSDNGNIFVEVQCRGKNSGILVSEADWWAFYFPNRKKIFYIKSDDLLRLILTNDFRLTEMSGDAGSNTMGYLIPRRKFQSEFIVFDL